MKDIPTLDRLKQLAEAHRETQARQLALLVTRRDEAKQKLKLLEDYLRDYQRRLTDATRSGINGEGLRNYRQFMTQLERAIEQQSGMTDLAERSVAEAQREWASHQRRVDSFQTLTDRRASAKAVVDTRRAQKQQDEVAARRTPRRLDDDS